MSERAALLGLSAALAAGDRTILDGALRAALLEASGAAVEEAILQSHLFLGYPVSLNALAAWRSISDSGPVTSEDGTLDRAERGARVCEAVYAGQYDALRDHVRRLHPDMERWMVEDGYGRVLGRPGLPLLERELCVVACLAVIDAPRQLYAHLRGALNVGATPDEVDAALEAAAAVSGPEARRTAAETWDAVRTRAAARS